MNRLSRSEALEIISNWSCADVLAVLKKSGVGEACCKAAEKRQIDGDELLHLTEGKLALWKTDLARPDIWNLWTFVEEVRKSPESFAQEQMRVDLSIGSDRRTESRASSDNISWDADLVERNASTPKPPVLRDDASPDFRSSLRMFQENDRRNNMQADSLRLSSPSLNRRSQDKSTEESSTPDGSVTYANLSDTSNNDNATTYANLPFANEANATTTTAKNDAEETLRNSSRLHKSATLNSKSLAEQLREQLELRANRSTTKTGSIQRPDNSPRESFLHCAKSNGTNSNTLPYFHKSRGSPISGLASLDGSSRASPGSTSGSDGGDHAQQLRNLPKPPPMSIRGLDLVANLPRRPTIGSDSDADAEDEEDDGEGYEAFDEQIVERHQQQRGSIVSADSVASLRDNQQQQQQQQPQQPPSSQPSDGGLDDEEVYEIYESITESPDDENGREYINADFKIRPDPPPLPARPPPNLTANLNNKNKTEAKSERSTESKSATLPHTGSSSSLSSSCSNNNSNAARPLPPPPNRQQSYIDRPWFHNLTREQANLLIQEKGTYDNTADGYFLIRPSTTNPTNPLVLVLWCKNRVYNVPIRKRPDNKYALGSAKTEEKSFTSVDDIIPYYKREKLVLYSGGVQSATAYLTETPPKH